MTALDERAGDLERENAELRRRLAEREAELAAREAELAEARDQQTAAAEVLRVINSSPGDLTPVFDAMLERAMNLCEAAFGLLITPQGELHRATAHRGLPPALADYFAGPVPMGQGLIGRLLAGEDYAQVIDAAADEAYRSGSPTRRALVDLGGARTGLAVALRKNDAYLGAFWLYRKEIRPFTDKQIALLQNFAAQAVIAMENARLITETREALEQQTATAEVLGVINASPGDLAPVFDAMLQKAVSLCDAAFGTLAIYDGERYAPAAAHGVPTAFADFRSERGAFAPPAGSSLERVANGENLVHLADVMLDPSQAATPLVQLGGARALICIGLRKEETLLGAITVYRQESRPFSEKQIALLQNFAAQAVIAIENARLITETREALEQQTATAEVLSVINASPGDVTPVFDTMLQKALRLCGADLGNLLTFNGECFEAAAGIYGTTWIGPERELSRTPFRPVPGGLLDRLVGGEHFMHTEDVRTEISYQLSPEFRQLVDGGGYQSMTHVSLRKEGRLLGAIVIFFKERRRLTDKQIALLQNFAAQAVIAMENARLITETREALEQQTATAEVLGVINSSPGDLSPVFDAMLERATRLCEATYGHLFTFDGELLHPVAVHGESEFAEWLREQGPVPPRGGPITRALHGGWVVSVPDIRTEEVYQSVPWLRELMDRGGIRSALTVALRKEDKPLGAFILYREEVRPFTDKQIALLQNFAAQAVIAMENARLISETREALEQQTATAEVLGVINSSPGELAPVFEAMLEKATRLCGASFGILRTYDGELFHAAAVYGVPAGCVEFLVRNPQLPAPDTSGARILDGESAVHIMDLSECEPYRAGEQHARALVDLGGAGTSLAIPLTKGGSVLGAFQIYRQEVRAFTAKQIALLQNFAAQAVVAIENARLITETREALEQQTATAEVLSVINSSPGDLAPVFDAMLERAMRLCGAAFGGLFLCEGELARTAATRGISQGLDEFVRGGFVYSHGLGRGEGISHIADLTKEPGNGIIAAAIELGGARTMLNVALRKNDRLVGFFSVFRQEVRPFTGKQIALLQNFAAQAVIAMENARLITETREALDQQTATAEVLGVINSSPGDLAPVFDAILAKAHTLCGAEIGSLGVFDGQYFRKVARHGYRGELDAFLSQPYPPAPHHAPLFRGEIIHAPDVMTFPWGDQTEAVHAWSKANGLRTWLEVPLWKENTLMGSISAWRREACAFSQNEIALLQNFAAQAVIAMENARLITETREALEQQTATAEVLGIINSSPGDLAPVFDAMLRKATSLCDAPFAGLQTFDNGMFNFVAHLGFPEAFVAATRGPQHPGPNTALGRIAAGELLIHIPDVAADDVYRAGDPTRRSFADLTGARTAIWVSLRKDDRLLGVFAIYRTEVRPFTDKQIALLSNFAAQAVIAMENARLLSELRQRTKEVAELNRGLEARVAEQVEELGRVGRLKRFLAPQLAELIVSQGDEKILESHRREIVVVFCDLRGYTAFTETAEPEDVLDFLREYHGALGPLVAQFEGTLDQFSGDGIMVFFNDPVPVPDPAERAVNMAVAMREAAGALIASWRRRGRELGFGAGIAQGYATLGQIGFADRSGYTAIGTVCNLAARLCAEAKDGQILIAQRVAVAVERTIALEEIGSLALKGLTQPVVAFNVPVVGNQASFRVIEGGHRAPD